MIGLAAPTADTSGDLMVKEFKPETYLRDPAARISRKKTLDGGVYIDHSGVSDGDRTFTISVPRVTDDQYTIIKHLHRNYTSITIACREGVFRASIEKIQLREGRADLTILVESKVSA